MGDEISQVAAILFIGLGAFFWLDSLRARERAVRAGRAACERYSLQFLDDTVSFTRVRLGRNAEGELRIARTYSFEFSDPENTRPPGAIFMRGSDVDDLHRDPYPVHPPLR